jgi:hypothetical protein
MKKEKRCLTSTSIADTEQVLDVQQQQGSKVTHGVQISQILS